MANLDLLHFEQLKKEIQKHFLKDHHTSAEDISKWKGIDILYFQEDLRRVAKGNISEKTFYTYFKAIPSTKLPRIDMLNLLSNYIGYKSWYEFKKKHVFANEIITGNEENPISIEIEPQKEEVEALKSSRNIIVSEKTKNSDVITKIENHAAISEEKKEIEPSISPKKQVIVTKADAFLQGNISKKSLLGKIKSFIWLIVSGVLGIIVFFLGFGDQIFSKEYTYTFVDADRNSTIRDQLEIKIIKENGESPILFKVKPNESFTYTTKSKSLKMIVTSPFYNDQEIYRNLENAPDKETIELKPNDYAQMLNFYTKSIKDLKKKREQLNNLISDNALIYQIYDNDTYGVETLTKQKYITLVTLPSTSLEKLQVIDTQKDKGRIVMIKFKIDFNETTK